jgi:acetyltransferase-like isoleucine patch superfamily enzyme
MRFDGRSFTKEALSYSRRERLVVRLSTHVMPLLTRLFMSHRVNTLAWRLLGCRVGPRSVIRMGTWINAPFRVRIGADCQIHGHLKSRGGIAIGDGVELVEDVLVSTQSHAIESPWFESVYREVAIGSRSWIGPRAIVLPGVVLGEGTVVAAAAVVTRGTADWSVVAGVPAVHVKSRPPLASPANAALRTATSGPAR